MQLDDQFRLAIAQDRDAVVVTVAGELDVATAPHLSEALADHGGHGTTIVFDLSQLRFIDSSGLAVLAALLRRRPPPQVVVRGASPVVRRVLDISQLATMVTVED